MQNYDKTELRLRLTFIDLRKSIFDTFYHRPTFSFKQWSSKQCYTCEYSVSLVKVVLHLLKQCYTCQDSATLVKTVLHLWIQRFTCQSSATLVKTVLHLSRQCYTCQDSATLVKTSINIILIENNTSYIIARQKTINKNTSVSIYVWTFENDGSRRRYCYLVSCFFKPKV